MAEKLIFTRKKTHGRAVGVTREVYNEVSMLSRQTGMNMTNVASKLISFALDHVVVDEGGEKAQEEEEQE